MQQIEDRERGETLIELVVAIAILGIGAVAILAGIMVSVKASDLQRKEATGGAYVRSFAEAIQRLVDNNGAFSSCSNAPGDYAAVTPPNFPGGYTKQVTAVETWNGTAWVPCATGDGQGVQRITLKVTSTGDATHRAVETLTVVLRKACNDSDGSPCTGP